VKGEKEIGLFKTQVAKHCRAEGATVSSINFSRMAIEWNRIASQTVPAIIGNKKKARRWIFKKSEAQLESYYKKNARTQEIKNTMETLVSPSHELILSLLSDDIQGIEIA